MIEQLIRKLTPTFPAKGASDVEIQERQVAAEIRRRARISPQPLQSTTPPLQPKTIQAQAYHCPGRVA